MCAAGPQEAALALVALLAEQAPDKLKLTLANGGESAAGATTYGQGAIAQAHVRAA